MRDTTAFISESMGACHLLAFVVDATTEGAYALEYEKADPGRHKSDSWHGRRDPWKRYMLAADVNARDGNERAEHALGDVVAARDQPPFAASAMDGYAFAGAQLRAGEPLRLRVLPVPPGPPTRSPKRGRP